jgi:thiol-disulfide isomerase/thioredoxin
MRKTLKITVLAIVLSVLGFMAYKISAKITKKQEIAQQIQTIPSFYFYKLGTDSVFTEVNLTPNKASLIVNFHPECGHCQYEAEIIGKQVNDFKAYQLLFISYAETETIKEFAKKYKLAGYPNIIFLEDKDMIFNDIFGKSGIPNSFIYDKNGKLLKQFKGEVKVEALLKYLGR